MAATFLRDLDPALAERFRDAAVSRTYPARSYLFYEGDPGSGVFIVDSGLLRIDRTTRSGKVALLELAVEGALIGEVSVLDGEPRSATLSTVTDATLRHMSANDFRAMVRSDPAIQAAVMIRLTRRLRALSSQFVENSTLDAPKRIAARLVRLIDIEQTFGRSHVDAQGCLDLKLPISQEELGQWAGLGREGTGKGLAVLRSLGIIETGRMRVRVIDVPRLVDLASSG